MSNTPTYRLYGESAIDFGRAHGYTPIGSSYVPTAYIDVPCTLVETKLRAITWQQLEREDAWRYALAAEALKALAIAPYGLHENDRQRLITLHRNMFEESSALPPAIDDTETAPKPTEVYTPDVGHVRETATRCLRDAHRHLGAGWEHVSPFVRYALTVNELVGIYRVRASDPNANHARMYAWFDACVQEIGVRTGVYTPPE